MEPDDWTPAAGWKIALGTAGIRCAVILSVAAVIDFLAYFLKFLPPHWAVLSFVFMICAAVGYPMGYLLSKNLVEDCGLAGKTIFIPVAFMLLLAHILAYVLVVLLWSQTHVIQFMLAVSVGFWSMPPLVRYLVIE